MFSKCCLNQMFFDLILPEDIFNMYSQGRIGPPPLSQTLGTHQCKCSSAVNPEGYIKLRAFIVLIVSCWLPITFLQHHGIFESISFVSPVTNFFDFIITIYYSL